MSRKIRNVVVEFDATGFSAEQLDKFTDEVIEVAKKWGIPVEFADLIPENPRFIEDRR